MGFGIMVGNNAARDWGSQYGGVLVEVRREREDVVRTPSTMREW